MRASDLSSVAADIIWFYVSNNITAKAGRGYFLDVNSSTRTLTLPSNPTQGDTVVISDVRSNSSNNNITIARNGEKIDGAASDYVMNEDGDCVQFVYFNSSYGWKLVARLEVAEGPATFYYSYGQYPSGTSKKDCYSFNRSSWVAETQGPLPNRFFCGGASDPNHSYVFGGDSGSLLKDCDAFNGSSWTSKTSMTTATRRQASAAMSWRVYSIGGETSASSEIRTTTSFDGTSWLSETDAPTPARAVGAGFKISSKIYYVSGYDGSNNTTDCDSYDGSTWSNESPIGTARRAATGSDDGTYGYFTSGKTTVGVTNHDRYDGSNWVAKNNITQDVVAASGDRLVDGIIVVGGVKTSTNSILNTCQTFDGTNWTTESAMNEQRAYGAGSST